MYSEDEKEKRFEQVCLRIEEGEPLRRILRSENAPMSQTVFYELLQDPVKNVRYARARDIYADVVAEEMLDIADSSNADVVGTDKFGNPIVDGEAIQRSKLKVDTRKWLLSKLRPKKYGDRLEVDQKTEATITWKEEKTYQTKNETND